MKRKNVILMLRREEVQKSSHYNEELPCDP